MKLRESNLWLASVVFAIAIASFTAFAAGPAAAAGKEVFARRCSGCHALDSNKEGPRLRGVVGRKAGSVPEFQYSDALRNSGILWSQSSLSKWLEGPQTLVSGSDMEFRVSNPDERAALVAYLESLK